MAIALPLLDAMIPTSLIGSAEAAQRVRNFGPHNRLLILYYPNGIHTPNWYPTIPGVKTLVDNSRPSPLTPEEVAAQEAKPIVARVPGPPFMTSEYEMAPGMKPLERHRKDFLLLGGLDVPLAKLDQAGDHAKALVCYLTGVRIRSTATDDIQAGISADQIIANAIGSQTRFPSLELGLDYGRMEGGCDPGYACIYSNNVSWKNATTPAIKEVNPRIVFDRLFGGAQASDHQRRDRATSRKPTTAASSTTRARASRASTACSA